jgi:endonuclease-3 related protein
MGGKDGGILRMYRLLLEHYGDLRWWPGETPFEIAVGAVLTQATNWRNVEKAIRNLKERGLLSPAAVVRAGAEELEEAVRPSGFFRVKAKRLRAFAEFVHSTSGGTLESLAGENPRALRGKLLGIAGIGEETADSILLYGLGMPVFVVDAYTRRILGRHGLLDGGERYGDIQRTFAAALPEDPRVYNRCHALLVQTGKDHCRKIPRCGGCPLSSEGHAPAGTGWGA